MAKRRYFTKAVAPPSKPERSPAWDKPYVSGHLPDGTARHYDPAWLRRMLACSKAGKAANARKGPKRWQFTSETGRKAVNRRWTSGSWRTKGYNRLVKGVRIGLRKPAKPLNYAELRNRYAIPRDGWRVRYDTGSKQWWVRDDLGERKCSQRIAMQYAGHRPRPSVFARLPKTFKGIDLQKEGWNRD